MHPRSAAVVFAVIAVAFALRAADTPFNLLPVDRFEPVVMHGKVSAARGWYMHDVPRFDYIFGKGIYLSGEECFELKCADGVFTFAFNDPLHEAYAKSKRTICFGSCVGYPWPPAPRYRTTGRIRFDRGELAFNNGIKLAPSPEWQIIDRTTARAWNEVRFRPEAGGEYSFADLRCEAVYPEIGGEIPLPNGGKLTRFLLPRDASFVMRWSVALWRGWLWKLTGVALPIETVDKVEGAPGAFAAIKGETAPGGWLLTVNSEGITLVYGDELAVSPALFDYLRLKLNCSFYHQSFSKLPPDGSCRELPAIRREAKPKFRTHTGSGVTAELGGLYLSLLYAYNTADYYHLHTAATDHILNIVLPMEIYYKPHPEYYMMNSAGKRVIKYNPFHINPCLSNPEVRQVMIRNAIAYAKAQVGPTLLDVNLADDNALCRCPNCIRLNGGIGNDSEAASLLANEMGEALAREVPGMKFTRCAYVTHRVPPKKIRTVDDDVILNYCTGHDTLPCTLHVDCEINRRGFAEIAEWGKIFDKSKIGFMTYRDVRPIRHLKFLERLNRDGNFGVYTFLWKGYSSSTSFITGRWNLGEDPEKLVEEFDHAFYGAGGKYVHEINLLVENYAANYKHTPEELKFAGLRHLCIWGGSLQARTVLDRKTLDKIYSLFAKAYEAAKDDPASLRRIAEEERFYLVEDLLRYNAPSCQTDAELAAFAERLKRLVKIVNTYRIYVILAESPHAFASAVTGVTIPDTGKFWTEEPEFLKIFADPVKMLRQRVEATPTGFYFIPGTLRSSVMPLEYSHQCPPRLAIALRRPSLGNSELSAVVKLDGNPAGAMLLAIEGLDDDKRGASTMRVSVNGRKIFEGPVAFPETRWGRMGFTIPAGSLKKGENIISVANITPDKPSRSARFSNPAEAAKDHQWGWIQISEICLLNPNGDFDRFAANGKVEMWRQKKDNESSPVGVVKPGDGKVEIIGSDAAYTGITFFRGHQFRKIAITPRGKARISFRASGNGQMRVGFLCYRPYLFDSEKKQIIARRGRRDDTTHYGNRFEIVKLDPSPKKITLEFSFNEGVGFIVPSLCVKDKGHAVISDFTLELLPPTQTR